MAEDAAVALSQVKTVADGLDHPECVTVDHDFTVWAGGEAGQVYRIDPMGGEARAVGSTGGFLLGVTADGGHHVYVCDIKHRAVLRMNVDTGSVETICTEVEGRRLVNPNFGVFDPAGRLYVTDSGHWQLNDGFLFAIEPDGTARVVNDRPRRFPNGLCLDYEEDTLYIAESTLPGITRLHLRDGRLETVVDLPGIVPDGLAIDRARTLYVACYRPDAVLRVVGQTVEVLVSDPQGTVIAAPTNVAFGGQDGQTLYIASLGRWHISAVHLEVPGLPFCYPARSSPGD